MMVYKSALGDITAAVEANRHVQIIVLLSPHTFIYGLFSDDYIVSSSGVINER
jgi:hypothetical protein